MTRPREARGVPDITAWRGAARPRGRCVGVLCLGVLCLGVPRPDADVLRERTESAASRSNDRPNRGPGGSCTLEWAIPSSRGGRHSDSPPDRRPARGCDTRPCRSRRACSTTGTWLVDVPTRQRPYRSGPIRPPRKPARAVPWMSSRPVAGPSGPDRRHYGLPAVSRAGGSPRPGEPGTTRERRTTDGVRPPAGGCLVAKVTMPQLGESVAEGTIGRWLKKPGDRVEKYEPIVEIITDKVNAEVPSPVAGILTAILVEEGTTVPNNAEIAEIDEAGGVDAAGAAAASVTPAAAAPEVAAPAPAPASVSVAVAPAPAPSATASAAPAPVGDADGRMTPAVRRLLREHGLSPAQVPGTGGGGRITREDVLAVVEAARTGRRHRWQHRRPRQHLRAPLRRRPERPRPRPPPSSSRRARTRSWCPCRGCARASRPR